ncbi:MAG: HAD-IC family P-type ATPase, partial [Actinomycetota bacterium]
MGDGPEETELRLLGLLGIADAPRPEAADAVRLAHAAGVRVVMITGDHPATAQSIASQLGITGEGYPAQDVVYARRTAADKLEIVHAMRKRGEIVAMTGDGVNDAPSIREADIGIAMGQTATEVTREASEMILTTDDLGGVVAAIREGRIIYANIRKTIVYLLGGNAAELLFML